MVVVIGKWLLRHAHFCVGGAYARSLRMSDPKRSSVGSSLSRMINAAPLFPLDNPRHVVSPYISRMSPRTLSSLARRRSESVLFLPRERRDQLNRANDERCPKPFTWSGTVAIFAGASSYLRLYRPGKRLIRDRERRCYF